MAYIQKKLYLTISNYKKLSKGIERETTDNLPRKLAVDVDSLIFMWIRSNFKYKKCAKLLKDLYQTLDVENVVFEFVYTHDVINLKEKVYQERKELNSRYNNRDIVRDKTMEYLFRKYNSLDKTKFVCTPEADKYCGNNYKYIITEDVDVFLFGNKWTTIINPLTLSILNCRKYYKSHGIQTYETFLKIAIIMGTDYNYGINRVSVKTIEKIVREYSSVEEYLYNNYDIFHPTSIEYLEEYYEVYNFFRS